MDYFPEASYKLDNNYFFKFSKKEKIKLFFALVKKLFIGFRKSSYEYFKAYLVFPLIYGRLTKQNFQDLLNKRKIAKQYLDNGILVRKFSQKELDLLCKELIKKNIFINEINTYNDPRFHIRLTSQNYPELVNLIKNILKNHHLDEISKLQLRRKKVRLEELYLFIQDTSKGWRDEIKELKDGTRTKTRYFHVDSSPKNKFTKFIIYLNDITDNNGPFEYVSKSHHLDQFPFSFLRRINHHARIQDVSSNSRKYFTR